VTVAEHLASEARRRTTQLGADMPARVPFPLRSVQSLFGWLVADGLCWFVLREKYCWLVAADCWWLVRSERKVLLDGG
jgi:hypothetical protein